MLPMVPTPGAARSAASAGSDAPPTVPADVAFAEHADAAGFDSVWVADHFLANLPFQAPREPVHEAWTIVSAVAARTRRVEIGQLVMCVSYRPAGTLAKMAATADAVSGGRLTLGIGAGWHDEEYEAFGFPTDHRVDRFEEAVRIIRPLVKGERVTLAGRYHSVAEAELLPLERPIPILIASARPRMLRLTARHADAWNTAWYGMPDDRLRERLAGFESALEAEGRDPGSIRRTVGVEVRPPGREPADGDGAVDASELPDAVEAYAGLGFDDVIVVSDDGSLEMLDRVSNALALGG